MGRKAGEAAIKNFMAWIESNQELKDHPKLFVLAERMGWNVYEAIGRLHVFWYWCLNYAPTGDLHKFNDGQLAMAVGLDSTSGKKFVEAMVSARWLDRSSGIFRVHDWPDYAGRYLRDSLYSKRPEKWQEVKELYQIKDITENKDSQPESCRNPALPNRTLPNSIVSGETAKPKREAWKPPELAEAILYCIEVGLPESEAQAFIDYFEARGWVLKGGVHMKSWRASLRTWKRNYDKVGPQLGINGHANHSANSRKNDRNAGTANEGRAHLYKANV